MFKIFLILTFISLTKALRFQIKQPDPDESASTFDLIKNKGYPAEQHNVTTQDGYILTMHRINKQPTKKVVLLQHGLMDSSSTWVINFPEQSLGFILADNDYDVWLGNMRGNTYSNRHIKYNITQEEFWDFSFDEMSKYDLTAMIDYILETTNQTQLYYVSHSQGTLIKFINSNPIYSNKIKLFIALGPVATVAYMNATLFNNLASIGEATNQNVWFNIFGRKSFASSKFDIVLHTICTLNNTKCGRSQNLNRTRMNVYFSHFPSGTSMKNMVHFAQMIMSKNVQMFDYGKIGNVIHYNQTTAPVYDLKKMTIPTAIYYGELDRLADPTDVEYIRNNLPHIVDDYCIKGWQHVDFVWALNAKQILYDRMIQLMNKYL